MREREKKDQKVIVGLEKQLEKRSQEVKSKEFMDGDEERKLQADLTKK